MRSRKRPGRPHRSAGRPLKVDELDASHIQRAAVRLVNKRGVAGLSLQALAASTDPPVTRTAPLHHFGSTVGVLAAVAAFGWEELTSRLRGARQAEPSAHALRDLALSYAEYALRNPNLYRAMHATHLWDAITKGETDGTKAARWTQRVQVSRDAAFEEFVAAVSDTKGAGRLKKQAARQLATSAHLLTAIVDGFLFHVFEEQIEAGSTTEARLRYLTGLVDLALSGLRAPSAASR